MLLVDSKLFEDKGWNQSLKFMIPEAKPKAGTLHPKQNFMKLLKLHI
jgi:hypothetical protein